MQSHNSIRASEYCIDWDKWLCKICVDVHMTYNSTHKYNKYAQEIICTSHNKKQKMGLCLSCNENLCRDCILKDEIDQSKENVNYYQKLINFLSKQYKEHQFFSGELITAMLYFNKYTKINRTYQNFCDVLYNNYENSNNNVVAYLNCIDNVLFSSQRMEIDKERPVIEKISKILFFFKFHYLFQFNSDEEIFILTRQNYLYIKENNTFFNLVDKFSCVVDSFSFNGIFTFKEQSTVTYSFNIKISTKIIFVPNSDSQIYVKLNSIALETRNRKQIKEIQKIHKQ